MKNSTFKVDSMIYLLKMVIFQGTQNIVPVHPSGSLVLQGDVSDLPDVEGRGTWVTWYTTKQEYD